MPRGKTGPAALSPVWQREPWVRHSWLPLCRCGTARRSRRGRGIGICGRGFSNRLFSQRHLISQVCKGRITPNRNLGRAKEGNTSKISFFVTSSVTEGFYPAVVESFVFLRDVGRAKQPRWRNQHTVQSTSGQKLVPHPAATGLALMIHTFLTPASGLLLPL